MHLHHEGQWKEYKGGVHIGIWGEGVEVVVQACGRYLQWENLKDFKR